MELRVLRYFLAVAREETISGAAEYLHVTQPTLSRQMMELEEELGKKLFIRGNRKISLTEEGMFLRKRAQEIVALVDRTESEFSVSDENISGDVSIGGGETDAMRLSPALPPGFRPGIPTSPITCSAAMPTTWRRGSTGGWWISASLSELWNCRNMIFSSCPYGTPGAS